jgi:hypothetical protein
MNATCKNVFLTCIIVSTYEGRMIEDRRMVQILYFNRQWAVGSIGKVVSLVIG